MGCLLKIADGIEWPPNCPFDNSYNYFSGYLIGYVIDYVTVRRVNGMNEGHANIHFLSPHHDELMECEYSKDKRNGPGYLLDRNGFFKLKCTFVNNIIEGPAEIYEDGVLVYSGVFSRGDRNGVGSEFDGSGTYIGDSFYRDGKRLNASIMYDAQGVAYMYMYDGNNNLEYMGTFDASTGNPDGRGTRYNADGTVRDVCVFSNGVVLQVIQSFHALEMSIYDANGVEVYKGGFEPTEDGRFLRSGQGVEFDGGHRIIYKGSFRGDKRDGAGKEFEDGMCVYDGGFPRVCGRVEVAASRAAACCRLTASGSRDRQWRLLRRCRTDCRSRFLRAWCCRRRRTASRR